MSQCTHDRNQGRRCTCAKSQPTVKRCTMNCGPSFGDTRTRKEIMAACDDCYVLNDRDHDLIAFDAFSEAMMTKLDKKRDEGRSGWQTASAEALTQMLIEHVQKGDPVDVANFCMMIHQNGFSILSPESIDPLSWKLPCDIKVGHGTIAKGCRLNTLVLRMNILYSIAVDKNGAEVVKEIETLRTENEGLEIALAAATKAIGEIK